MIAVAAQSSPTVEDYRTAVGPVMFHFIEKHVVAPECLTEAVDERACEILLPVEPPEVYTLFFKWTDEVFEECFGKLFVFEVPCDALFFVGIDA